ncbi:peptidylprolyl isomerase [Marinicauda salina]|uniref:Parvulin-like PPIase n=1 Tax=Marinicauda salina TaxID=2135793 RepID=A0A2U2BTL5_9PROT|nr:peptidylprolyl isomerase [Marinicauda salina]PWE17342.1 peptidylprolyl isomerase [Marinicauda salina]
MAIRYAVLALCAALLTAAVAPRAPAQQVEGIAAVVNDEPITTLDVRDRMRLIIFSAGVQPTEEALVRIQDQALRGLIDETLQLQQAREYEVEVTQEEVDAAIADIAERNGSTVEEIEQQLTSNGISVATLRQQIRAETAWQILVSGRYRSRVRISEQQIQMTLERMAQNASEPQYRLGEILIEVTGQNEDRARGMVQTVYEQLNQGVSFTTLAQQFSDAPSAANGGDTGWLTESQLRPQIAEAVQELPGPGSISPPIRVPGGYRIIALIDSREGAAVEQLTLKQITLPASQIDEDSRSRLEREVDRLEGCEGVEAAAGQVEGAIATDLGTIGANAVIPRIRDALSGLEPGQATDLIETAAGLQVFVLCDRSIGGAGIPSADQIENQLTNQQLSLLSRRWLRDVRREATIDIR